MKYLKLYENFEDGFEEVWEEEPSYYVNLDRVKLGKNGPKFNVLDIVITRDYPLTTKNNKIGYIIDYDDVSNCYLIYFIDNIGGYGRNNIPHGHAWCVTSKYIEKI